MRGDSSGGRVVRRGRYAEAERNDAAILEAAREVFLADPTAPISAVANWVTFTPDSTMIYISNAGLRSVTAIDTKERKVVAVIPVGEVPKRINTLVIPDSLQPAATSSHHHRASLR